MAAKKNDTKPDEVKSATAPASETTTTSTDLTSVANASPAEMAIADPAPATAMESPSGAFIEPEIKDAIPLDHPSVDNNPRAGTSAVQNGGDFNDPNRVHPQDPDFAGQGLDLSVYGKTGAGVDQSDDK